MKIDWHIDPNARVVYLKYSGTTEFAYWSATMHRILADEHYEPGFGFVAEIDGALVPDTAVLTQMLNFVERRGPEFKGSRWANVTVNPAHFGMTRMAQARSQHFTSELAVFTTVAEAEQWAGRASAADEPPSEDHPSGHG